MSEALKKLRGKLEHEEHWRKHKEELLGKRPSLFTEKQAEQLKRDISNTRKEEQRITSELKAAEKEYIKTLKRDIEQAIGFIGTLIADEEESRKTYIRFARQYRKLGIPTLAALLITLSVDEREHVIKLSTLAHKLKLELDRKLAEV